MKKLDREEFIRRAKEIHNDKYDYSKLVYDGYRTPVRIICPIHGEFEQSVDNHLTNKSGCLKCSRDNHRMTTDKYIEKAKKVHGDKYDYSLVDYINDKTKVKIICPVHGEFNQRPFIHLNNHGCPECSQFKGEKRITEILQKNDIRYETQKTFNGCRYKRKLKFDFYLPEYNTCIEYDGEHHFREVKYYGGSDFLQVSKNRDFIKNSYCKDNNITLIRIKYTEFDTIEDIINKKVNCIFNI